MGLGEDVYVLDRILGAAFGCGEAVELPTEDLTVEGLDAGEICGGNYSP